jgi:hypothetical protein
MEITPELDLEELRQMMGARFYTTADARELRDLWLEAGKRSTSCMMPRDWDKALASIKRQPKRDIDLTVPQRLTSRYGLLDGNASVTVPMTTMEFDAFETMRLAAGMRKAEFVRYLILERAKNTGLLETLIARRGPLKPSIHGDSPTRFEWDPSEKE